MDMSHAIDRRKSGAKARSKPTQNELNTLPGKARIAELRLLKRRSVDKLLVFKPFIVINNNSKNYQVIPVNSQDPQFDALPSRDSVLVKKGDASARLLVGDFVRVNMKDDEPEIACILQLRAFSAEATMMEVVYLCTRDQAQQDGCNNLHNWERDVSCYFTNYFDCHCVTTVLCLANREDESFSVGQDKVVHVNFNVRKKYSLEPPEDKKVNWVLDLVKARTSQPAGGLQNYLLR